MTTYTGRVDMKQYIGTCTHSQLRRMFARFFMDSVDATPELSEKFAVRALEGVLFGCPKHTLMRV
jgi:hypothetical protein